jgi:hypothetical protein
MIAAWVALAPCTKLPGCAHRRYDVLSRLRKGGVVLINAPWKTLEVRGRAGARPSGRGQPVRSRLKAQQAAAVVATSDVGHVLHLKQL